MQRIIQFGKQLFDRIMYADVFGLAAQVSYFLLLSLFPLLLFLATLVGYFPIDESAFMSFIESFAPDEIVDMIQANISDLLSGTNGGLLSIGIIGTLWSASNGINAIKKAFNKAYDVKENRPFLVSRLISIVLTLSMIGVLGVAFILPIFGEMIGTYVFSFIGLSDTFIEIWNTLRWVISSLVFFLVLLALYVLAPNLKVRIRNAMYGAIFATISWQAVTIGFSFYVNNLTDYSATYGGLGAVIMLMFWFYISSIVIIIGGVINAVVRKKRLDKNKLPV